MIIIAVIQKITINPTVITINIILVVMGIMNILLMATDITDLLLMMIMNTNRIILLPLTIINRMSLTFHLITGNRKGVNIGESISKID